MRTWDAHAGSTICVRLPAMPGPIRYTDERELYYGLDLHGDANEYNHTEV